MSRAWIVGGAVRDDLLGRQVTDVDVVVEGELEAAARGLADHLGGPVFQLSEAFGAWRAIDRAGGRVFDLSPLHGSGIEEDLARRDFSVNAMARPLADSSAHALAEGAATMSAGELIDPLAGRPDLDAGILRVLGSGAYEADPLRPLRLARFAA